MLYEKKIKYLDYRENGERIKGSGFVKLEVRNGNLRMEMNVTGLHPTDSFARDVMLCGGGREAVVGKVEISAGKGQYRQTWRDLGNIGGSGIGYGEMSGIRVPLGTERDIACFWQGAAEKIGAIAEGKTAAGKITEEEKVAAGKTTEEGKAAAGKTTEEGVALAGKTAVEKIGAEKKPAGAEAAEEGRDSERHTGKENVRKGIIEEEKAAVKMIQNIEEREFPKERAVIGMESMETQAVFRIPDKEAVTCRMADNMASDMADDTTDATAAEVQAVAKEMENQMGNYDMEKNVRFRREKGAGKPVRLLEDKWSQLWAIYPHICPFQDKREYISIGPEDFVLFPASSYKIVNNSFLLHGYYNYRHLILVRTEKSGEILYYIGVPGNFYEKEKQVAVMFGFESFECAEEPAQTGDFGYYMMRTEL